MLRAQSAAEIWAKSRRMPLMSGMTASEIDALVYKYIGDDKGYLVGFSYAEHERFYVAYCPPFEVDVRAARQEYGTTKKAFIGILESAAPADQALIVRGVLAKRPPDSFLESEYAEKTLLAARFEDIAARLAGNAVPSTVPRSTAATVQRAIQDAEALIRSSGPTSAVDRLHTALHGHLKHLCQEAGIPLSDDAAITAVWSTLINQHPALQIPEPRREEIKKVLRSASGMIDAVNTIRNRASAAHANEELLSDHEAWLVVNLCRTLLQYLDHKLGA